MHRIAIIDLGTNTFNLLIADKTNDSVKIIYRSKQEVKLGKGGINQNRINEEAFQRGLNALKNYLHTITEYQCDTVKAFATSAIRSSSNGSLFVSEAKTNLGLDIQIISGDREAELIYKGVRTSINMEETSLIMDIGGGSTEFILGNNHEILWSKSYDLGVSRLLENFRPSDPIKAEEVREIEHFLLKKLFDLIDVCKEHRPKKLIGSSGSFETFAAILSYPEEISGIYEYDLNQLEDLHILLQQATLAERLALPGMIPMRADMIVLSSILIQLVLKNSDITSMVLSTAALKEGVLSEM